MEPAGYLTKSEVAKLLKKSPKTVERWCKDGILPHIRIGEGRGADLLFDWEEVRKHLQQKYSVIITQ